MEECSVRSDLINMYITLHTCCIINQPCYMHFSLSPTPPSAVASELWRGNVQPREVFPVVLCQAGWKTRGKFLEIR